MSLVVTPFESAPHAPGAAPSPSGVPEAALPFVFPQDADETGTFAVIDGAKVPGLAERLAASGLEHDSLFNAEGRDDYADSGPWLVRFEPGNAFVRDFFSTTEQDTKPWALWDCAPGIILRAACDFRTLRAHFRRFTKVRDDQGKWIYFRFYEDWVLQCYLETVGDDPDRLTDLMATRDGDWITFVTRGKVYQAEPQLKKRPLSRSPTLIDEPVRAAFRAARWQSFEAKLIAAVRADDRMPVSIVDKDISRVANAAFDRGYRSERSIYNMVRAWLLLNDDGDRLSAVEQGVDPEWRLTSTERSSKIFEQASLITYGAEARHA